MRSSGSGPDACDGCTAVSARTLTQGDVGDGLQRSPSIGVGVEVDWSAFDPWRIQPVRHSLMAHRLLQWPALVALGQRLEARGSVRMHASTATAGTPFNEAPNLHPNRRSAQSTLQSIEQAQAWMSLLNVQVDPTYRELVGEVLDSVQPQIERFDPGMSYRAGWIFVSSPHAVTPFHFDKEHNFILQVQGRKRVYVWDPDDTVVASEHARDLFHHRHARDLLAWRDEFRERAHVFDLQPGQGAYMPSTSPHVVENGDGASITMSFTYYTTATRRNALLHKIHALVRQTGWTPPAVGRSPVLDAITHGSAKTVMSARDHIRRPDRNVAGLRYAPVSM